MTDVDLQRVRTACARVVLPTPFLLVGEGGLSLVESGARTPSGREPLVIDGEGVVLRSGAVFVWCRSGCCAENPQRWSSVEEAAGFHGSYIVNMEKTEGRTVRIPDRPE